MANNTNLSFPSAFCQQFFKDGKPLSSGKLYTYIAGSSTSVVTYKTISGGTESANMNTNPIILDMSGKANLVISKDTAYKFVLFDRNDVKVDEWDNVTAGGSEGGCSSEEIVVEGTTDEINVSSNVTLGVKHYVVSLSNTIKSAILRLLGLYENVAISLESKADKVQGAMTGNLAALDAEGNLTDSGSKVSDLSGKLDKTGDASNTTATFTIASSRTNISSGEKLSTIFGKIAKWFSDLKAVAFSGSYTDLSDKPTIPAAANNGVLTIKQNGTSKGTFSANQSTDSEINVTDTTYESKPEASGGTAVSLVTTGEKYTWNHKQNALPTSGTASSTYAINISGEADMANHLIRAYVNKSNQTTKSWKKIATSKTFTHWDAGSICFLYNHSGYQNEFGLDSIVSVTIHTSDAGSLSNARIDTYSYRSASETQLVRIGSTNQYEVWVKVPTQDTNMNATVLNSYGNWTINTDASQTGQLTDDEFTAYKSSNPSVGTSYNYNIAKASKIGVGSTRLPIFANSDGILCPMNIDEYYCWAQPTPQWTDVMEMAVWYVQNQCNNEILGSTRNINLNATHPSLCYLHVKLPELQGAGRYRFTLEFEITNSSGQNGTSAYGVLLLDPPTGYSGEAFLAECVYDSNGKAQSSVMNQIHVPPQGSTYRHKLYVDGHTYRVVKTK